VAIALWVVHTYLFENELHTPYLSIRSAEKRSGKTNLLDCLRPLVNRGIMTNSMTTATAFRVVEQFHPTLLVDEFEKVDEELRLILNAGYRRGGVVPRCIGDDFEVKFFPTFCPKAFASNKKFRIPDTIHDRSLIIELKRKSKADPSVERFRSDLHESAVQPLRRKLIRWVIDNADAVAELDPPDLAGLHDRANDNWRPLLKIADVIGGEWPDRARESAKILADVEDDEDSVGIRLLGDIKKIFEDHKAAQLFSQTIADDLGDREDRPWSEWGRQQDKITKRQVARLLSRYGIKPKILRIGDTVARGYHLDQFQDAFNRYLSLDTPSRNVTTVTN